MFIGSKCMAAFYRKADESRNIRQSKASKIIQPLQNATDTMTAVPYDEFLPGFPQLI
jgi:hypothetical protein